VSDTVFLKKSVLNCGIRCQTLPIIEKGAYVTMGIIYRPLIESDAEQFHALVNRIKDEKKYLYYSLRFSLQDTKAYIQQHDKKQAPIWGAFEAGIENTKKNSPDTNEVLVGWIDYNAGSYPEIAHVATLGMGLAETYRGKGIGSRLMERCFESARRQGIEKIELEVFAGNPAAHALYRKYGFVEEGVRVRYRKFEENYEDVICMGIFL
jgi:RimJ/RimL family protein N-acetyltransferase